MTKIRYNSTRGRNNKNRRTKARQQGRRHWHKRLMLHPTFTFGLLCTGVLMFGWTFHSFAASLISSIVHAPPITQAAAIVYPVDQAVFTSSNLTVSGNCPVNSYVVLEQNNIASGSSACSNGSFSVATMLVAGADELVAHVFNSTNDEGPTSTPVTVYYNPPAQAPAIVPPSPTPIPNPAAPQPVNLDNFAAFASGSGVTVSGVPGQVYTFTLFSGGQSVSHSLTIQSLTSRQANLTLQPNSLNLSLQSGQTVLEDPDKTGLPTLGIKVLALNSTQIWLELWKPAPPIPPAFTVTTDFDSQTFQVGQQFSAQLILKGGQSPYNVTTQWGDTTSSILTASGNSFAITHTYDQAGTYTILAKITDANGATTQLQLVAHVQNPTVPAATNKSASSDGGKVGAWLRQWLWVAWPVYGILVLMVASFWLGEHAEYQHIFRRIKSRHP